MHGTRFGSCRPWFEKKKNDDRTKWTRGTNQIKPYHIKERFFFFLRKRMALHQCQILFGDPCFYWTDHAVDIFFLRTDSVKHCWWYTTVSYRLFFIPTACFMANWILNFKSIKYGASILQIWKPPLKLFHLAWIIHNSQRVPVTIQFMLSVRFNHIYQI